MTHEFSDTLHVVRYPTAVDLDPTEPVLTECEERGLSLVTGWMLVTLAVVLLSGACAGLLSLARVAKGVL